MSNARSNQASSMVLSLPALSAWQNGGSARKQGAVSYSQALSKVWKNPLQFRREVRVDKIDQPNTDPYAIVALTQRGTGLFAEEVVMVKQRARQVVTVMRTLGDGVRLLSWRVNADGSLLRTGSSSLAIDAVQQVQVVRARNYVVACRTQSGEVQLSRWDVSNTGAIYLAGAHPGCAQQVQWLEMIALTPDLIVTFGLTTAETWQLMLWQLQGDSEVKLLHTNEISAAPVSSCGLAVLPVHGNTLRLATVVSETPTMLALHLWHYTPGEALTWGATHHIPTPEVASVMVVHIDRTHFQVVVQTLAGQLRLLTWQLAADGQIVLADHVTVLGEEVSQCTCQTHDDGFSLVYRTVAGELRVERWQQQTDGSMLLVGAGGNRVARLGDVICCDEALEGNAPLLTGMIDTQGEVILSTWRMEQGSTGEA